MQTAPLPFFSLFVLLVLLLLAALITKRQKQARVDSTSEDSPRVDACKPAASTDDRSLLIAFASQSGFAETIAWRTAEAARGSGVPVTLAELGSIESFALARTRRALFVVSTTGDGDPPDSARRFADRCMSRAAKLEGLEYGLLALGDRGYSRFCGFGRRLDRWLAKSRAKPMAPRIEVNNGDPGALEAWYRQLASLGVMQGGVEASPRYFRWKLVDRQLMNPGSPGGPVWLVALTPVDTPPAWQAGDIAEVFPGPASRAFSDDPELRPREYTVASLPEDGRLELVVRASRAPHGNPGLASGWLTQHAAPGERIALRLRGNTAFHAPADDRPMLLVGNGTGIAGLRGHLKARERLGRHRNWLVFGERTSTYDWLFRDEIEAWRSSGHLVRFDAAFSRDTPERVYVQHRLLAAAEEVRKWVAANASIYVCGSREGMAEGVTSALATIVGEERLEQMMAERRYCRDVY